MSHDKNIIAKKQDSVPTSYDIKDDENIYFNEVDEGLTCKVEPSYKLLLSLAQELKSKKQYQDAKKVFQQIFEKYPEKPQGLRGLIQISQQTNDWQQVIKLTSLLINKFPEICQGYWAKGNAYLKLKKHTQAKNQFEQLQALFPNEILGTVGLIKLAKEHNDLQLLVKLIENFIDTFPSIWNSYWYDSDMKSKMHIDYISALLDTGKVNKAESIACHFQTIYPESISIHHALILVYQKKQEYNKSFNNFELSLKLTDNSLIKKDIIILSKVTFMKLRFFSEYEVLINELMESFPNRVDVLTAWLELPVLGLPLIRSWEIDIKKLDEILDRKPNHIKFSDERASLLLSTGRLNAAEIFLREQIQKRPRHLGLNRKYCICAHHRKDWKEAENRFDNFYKIFPNDKSDVFFYYIHVLYKLSKFDKLQAEYKKFNSKRFKNFDNFDALDELQSNLLLGNYEKVEDLDDYNHYKVKNKFEHLYKEENLSIKKVINNPKNEVLFVCLGGIHENAPKQYALNKFENTNYFDKTISIKKDNHSFQGLADKTTQFNYLLINDFSSSYCLIKKGL
ncbi:tetratricopeptide repeat protein [Psychrobacter sp. 1Y1]|uniref:tetratricopeptide repeat protein n=1 Tax=Psychrobacter sp. 1Y1 TaxID=3453574 RepID=UPI003F457823